MLATYRFILAVHVVFGTIALPSFWVAIAARKGSPLHLRAGKTYLFTMAATAALTVVLGIWTLLDPNGTHPAAAGSSPDELAALARITGILIPSLGVLAVATLTLLYFGWRAPARVRPRSMTSRAIDWMVPGTLCALGVAGLPLGRVDGLEFAGGMGVVCILFALPQLAAVARAGRGRIWIVEHLEGLGGAAVIGHAALFVSVMPRLAPAIWTRDPFENAIPWILPPLFGVALLRWGIWYWRRRALAGVELSAGAVLRAQATVHALARNRI